MSRSWNRPVVATFATLAVALFVVSCARPAGDTASAPAEWTPEEKIARGELLAAFGGCNDCHTPGGLYGAPDMSRTLAGSDVGWVGPWGTSYATNLTPDKETGLGNWTEEQLATTLRTGHRPDGTPLLPPMPWPNIARLDEKDMGALVAYLRSLPAVKHAKPANLPPGTVPSGPTAVIGMPGAWDAPKMPEAAPADTAQKG